MNRGLYVLFVLMCGLFVNGCTSPKNTDLLEREPPLLKVGTGRDDIQFEKNGGAKIGVISPSGGERGVSETSDRNARSKSIHQVFAKGFSCYDNVSDKSENVSLSSLIWTKKQFNSSDVKGKSRIQFSTTSESVLNITFIVDGYAIRQEALLTGVDFDVRNDAIILNDVFGAAVNNGTRPNQVSLRPEANRIIATVNSSEKYEFKGNDLACELKGR